MNVLERRKMLEQRIYLVGEVSYAGLAKEFGVSEMTIRRDIGRLEQRGVVRRVSRGAIARAPKDAEPTFLSRAAEAAPAKAAIAAAIVETFAVGDTVVLDSGSTVLAVARAIRDRELELTVITPSLLAAIELADEPDTNVVLTGGDVRPGELSLTGSDAENAFARYNADVFVMGVAAVHPVRGVSDYHRGESAVKRAAMTASDRTVVAADSSKIGRSALVNIATPNQLDALVTDDGVSYDDTTLESYSRLGVEVVRVEVPESHSD